MDRVGERLMDGSMDRWIDGSTDRRFDSSEETTIACVFQFRDSRQNRIEIAMVCLLVSLSLSPSLGVRRRDRLDEWRCSLADDSPLIDLPPLVALSLSLSLSLFL